MIEGLDYAWGKPSASAMVAGGKHFACRYLSYDTTGKNLSKSEVASLTNAGISIVSNWEWDSRDAKGGYANGVKVATEARKQAIALGMPASRPIYFSVDFAPSTFDWPIIGEYFRGIRSILGYSGCGVYGGYDTVNHAIADKWCGWYWQTYAWSGGRWHPSAHIQQYRNGVQFDGADCDLDRAMTTDYGQWPISGGDDMGGEWADAMLHVGGSDSGPLVATEYRIDGRQGNSGVEQLAEIRGEIAKLRASTTILDKLQTADTAEIVALLKATLGTRAVEIGTALAA